MELWDILDEYGNKTGRTIERGKPMGEGEYFRVVDVWIVNRRGEFLISKRSPNTNPYPNKWQPTCGYAIFGDDSISAALRETKEELGIDLKAENGRLIKSFITWKNAIIDVWLFYQDFDINNIIFQPEETVDAMWATSQQIEQLIEAGQILNSERLPYVSELIKICNE